MRLPETEREEAIRATPNEQRLGTGILLTGGTALITGCANLPDFLSYAVTPEQKALTILGWGGVCVGTGVAGVVIGECLGIFNFKR